MATIYWYISFEVFSGITTSACRFSCTVPSRINLVSKMKNIFHSNSNICKFTHWLCPENNYANKYFVKLRSFMDDISTDNQSKIWQCILSIRMWPKLLLHIWCCGFTTYVRAGSCYPIEKYESIVIAVFRMTSYLWFSINIRELSSACCAHLDTIINLLNADKLFPVLFSR